MNMMIKSNIKSLIFFIFVLLVILPVNTIATPYTVAALAQQDIKNPKHVKMLVALADSGNISAQYNLAKYYETGKGVQKNAYIAKNWLQDATRSGLIQAYLKMNSKAIAPAKGVRLEFSQDPLTWLSKQSPDSYTIQIASSNSKERMKKYYEKHNLSKVSGTFHYFRSSDESYAMIHGAFNSVAAAKTAMSKLPPELKAQSPWIRNISTFKQANN